MKQESVKIGRITKLSDDAFNGNHPNGINKGYITEGKITIGPVVGERFYIGKFSTSIVLEIIDENTFKTLYSTYKLEYI